jgi:hypothetical protein
VRLHCGDLRSHDGAVISSAAVRFGPQSVPMPARCSRGVVVEIDTGSGAVPGCYRGTLLADGHPGLWLPVELTITAGDS